MTLTIGQQGKLGNEVLTVVSFNEMTFKCDNGKSYMIKNATWMTEGAIVAAPKEKKAKKYNACPEGFYNEMTKEEARRADEYVENSKYRQAGSSLRK